MWGYLIPCQILAFWMAIAWSKSRAAALEAPNAKYALKGRGDVELSKCPENWYLQVSTIGTTGIYMYLQQIPHFDGTVW